MEEKIWSAIQVSEKIDKLTRMKTILSNAGKDTTEIDKWLTGWTEKLANL